jgi:integrase
MANSEPNRGGIGFTSRGKKIEATFNVPASELPEGAPRKRITAQGDSREEAQRNLLAKLAKANLRVPVIGTSNKMTLAMWLDEWVEDYLKFRVQESTLNVYLGHIETYIKPFIGHLPLETMTINDLKIHWWDKIRVIYKLDSDGNETDQPVLGASSLSNVYKTLKMALDAAGDKYQIRANINSKFFKTPLVSRPESDREIAKAAVELEKLFFEDMSRDDPNWSHFVLVLVGLRQAERLGLTVQSVVLDDGEPRLEIHQQLDFSNAQGGWYLKNTTKNGKPREIPLWGDFLEAVEIRLAQREEMSRKPDWNPDEKFADLLFLGEGGKLITRRQDTPMWHALGTGMRGHLARHITGHILAKSDISTETAKKILGHQSDAYMHYYRVVSSEMASKELKSKYRPGERKRK